MSNTLGRTERLKSRKHINKVFAEGKVIQKFPLRAMVLLDKDQHFPASLQCGFTVSTRNFKKAVLRNRIRRIIKEVYRKKKTALLKILEERDQRLELFLVYTGREVPTYIEIEEAMEQVLLRIIQYLDNHRLHGPKLKA